MTADFDVNVGHGIPVSLYHCSTIGNNSRCWEQVDLQVTGTDSDGNQFPQAVTWLENNEFQRTLTQTDDAGVYQFNGRSAGSLST